MYLHITGSGEDNEDDNAVCYTLIAETDTHRTTVTFYELRDEFNEFAEKLKSFPFEARENVVYEDGYWENSGYNIRLTVSLVGRTGKVSLTVETKDLQTGDHARFTDFVEVSGLQLLSQRIASTDFSKPAMLDWNSSASL